MGIESSGKSRRLSSVSSDQSAIFSHSKERNGKYFEGNFSHFVSPITGEDYHMNPYVLPSKGHKYNSNDSRYVIIYMYSVIVTKEAKIRKIFYGDTIIEKLQVHADLAANNVKKEFEKKNLVVPFIREGHTYIATRVSPDLDLTSDRNNSVVQNLRRLMCCR